MTRESEIRSAVDRIMADDYSFGRAVAEALAQHPAHMGVALRKALSTGNITDMLEADDMIRKAAECLAEEEWHLAHRQQFHVVA